MSAIKRYKEKVEAKWNDCYSRNIWRTVHQAGSEEMNRQLAVVETDLFLFPTKEKCENLLNNKNITKCPFTFNEDFFIHKSLKEYFLNLKECVALDYGCGSLVRYTTEFAKIFKKCIGVDISSKAIEYSRKYTKDIENIKIVKVDGVSLKEFDDNSIDFIFSNLVFQHVGTKSVMLNLVEEMNRILKIDGIFRGSFWTEEKPEKHEHVYDGTGFSVEGYEKVFKDRGFNVESVSHKYPIYWVTLKKVQM